VLISPVPVRGRQSYRHEALLWRGRDDFAAALVPFVRDGLAAGEAVMVALVPEHANWVRAGLGAQAAKVQFVDMAKLGKNPARIIPAWQDFLRRHCVDGRPARGIGEPIWAGRRPEEVLECQLHEALLNLSIDPELPFWLVCPYDEEHLDASILTEAHRSHPAITSGSSYQGSPAYGGHPHADAIFTAGLPPIPGYPARLAVTALNTGDTFTFVALQAAAAGLWSDMVVNLADVVQGLTLASLKRGADRAVVRIWDRPRALICEVADTSVLNDHLAGRRAPDTSRDDPLWWANSICDLVQTRSGATGTTVRLHTWK
jgi:hypothetical protein